MMGRFNPDLTPQPILHDIRRSGSSTDGLMAPMRHDVMPLTNINDTAMIDPKYISTSNAVDHTLTLSSFDLTTPVDPSFWPSQISTPPNQTGSSPLPCACLSLTYLTLNTLHTLNDFSFPQIVPSLRTATTTLSTLIHCPTCPLDPFSATQNLQSIVSLFKALVLRFNKVLLEVDAEATRLMQNSEKKPFRVGDNSAALAHLHTGTPDCPMGFNIQLEAREWSKIVKTALRTEVWGGGSNTKPLVELLAETEERQRRWHAEPDLWKEEMGHLKGGRKCAREGICEALGAEHIRRSIEELVWE